MSKIPGVQDLGLFRIIGQPNLTLTVDRQAAARWGINVADVQDAIQTAVGGNAVSQVLQGEARYDLVLRYQKQYRDTRQAIENVRLLSPSGERVSLAQLTRIDTNDGAEQIYREGEQRYIAVKYSVRDRDLGSTVEEAIDKVNKEVALPIGYHFVWAGEYESKQRADKRLAIIVPLTILLIFIILYMMSQVVQVGDPDPDQRSTGARRWIAGAVGNAYEHQRLIKRRLSRLVWRVCPNRRHHARVHESTAGSWSFDREVSS
jgi:cobalt-zinc-cadmium resistance protein CzcA